jgi:hypothetical protein
VAETIDDTRDLERGYRRLVAFYPRVILICWKQSWLYYESQSA